MSAGPDNRRRIPYRRPGYSLDEARQVNEAVMQLLPEAERMLGYSRDETERDKEPSLVTR